MTQKLSTGAEPIQRYNRVAMALHWIVAALIAVNVVYGLKAASADDAHVRALIEMHKSIGLTILGLVLLRVLWRLGHRPPPMPSAYPRYERKGAHVAHALLYLVMLALPLTGYIHDSAWKAAADHPIELYGILHFPRIGWVENARTFRLWRRAHLARLRALRPLRSPRRRRPEAPPLRPRAGTVAHAPGTAQHGRHGTVGLIFVAHRVEAEAQDRYKSGRRL